MPTGYYVRTDEYRKKMSLAMKKVAHTPEWNAKVSVARKNFIAKNGYLNSPEARIKMGAWQKGRRMSEETRVKMKASARRGSDNNMWMGGTTHPNRIARTSQQYKNWRKDVFKRDNYTCVNCGAKGVYLHADHIKQFAFYPELRYEVSNGRTLCVPCHQQTDT